MRAQGYLNYTCRFSREVLFCYLTRVQCKCLLIFSLPSVVMRICYFFPSVVGCFHCGCLLSFWASSWAACCACRIIGACSIFRLPTTAASKANPLSSTSPTVFPQLHRPSSSSVSCSSALSCWVFHFECRFSLFWYDHCFLLLSWAAPFAFGRISLSRSCNACG